MNATPTTQIKSNSFYLLGPPTPLDKKYSSQSSDSANCDLYLQLTMHEEI